MKKQPQWANNKALLIQLAENFKLLEEENQKIKEELNAKSKMDFSKDQQKILRLYNYKNWSEYIGWVDEKLEESGEIVDQADNTSIKRVLSQILEQPDFEDSYTIDRRKEDEENKIETESQLLAMENAKLRRQNITLKSKLNQIRALYSNLGKY